MKKEVLVPSYLVKLNDYYFEFSTIVDAPTTFGMSLEDFKKYYREMYGLDGMRILDERLERVERYGTSSQLKETAAEMLGGNRAGPNEEELTTDEIFKAYCLQEPIRDGWVVPSV